MIPGPPPTSPEMEAPRRITRDTPLTREWTTVYWPEGRHYVSKVSDHLTLDVYRRLGGSTWEYAVIGNDMSRPDQPLIVKFGIAGTMREAKLYAEAMIPNPMRNPSIWDHQNERPDQEEVPF